MTHYDEQSSLYARLGRLAVLHEGAAPTRIKPGKWRKTKHEGRPAWDNKQGIMITTTEEGPFLLVHTKSGKGVALGRAGDKRSKLGEFKKLGDLLMHATPKVFSARSPKPGSKAMTLAKEVVDTFFRDGYARAVARVSMKRDKKTLQLKRTGPKKEGIVTPDNVAVGDMVLVSESRAVSLRPGNEYEVDYRASYPYRNNTPLRMVSKITATSITLELQNLGVSRDLKREVYKATESYEPACYYRRGVILLHEEEPYILGPYQDGKTRGS